LETWDARKYIRLIFPANHVKNRMGLLRIYFEARLNRRLTELKNIEGVSK